MPHGLVGHPALFIPTLVHEGIYADHLHFTDSLAEGLIAARYIIVAVATPQAPTGEPDLSQVYSVVDAIPPLTTTSTILIVKSTVPVGCFRDLRTRLEAAGVARNRVELASCPEFLAEGTAVHDFFHPTRTIVGAEREETAREISALFSGVTGPRVYTTPETAQLIKDTSNSFLASRVAFINKIARICELFGTDVGHICSLADRGEAVAVYGVAFKPGTSDVRNSLSVRVMRALVQHGRVVTNDPEALGYARPLLMADGVRCEENPWEAARGSDAQAFLTAWPEYQQLDLVRLAQVVRQAKIFDGPGLFDPQKVQACGFEYRGVGRVGATSKTIIES